jgi:hypothetical protein
LGKKTDRETQLVFQIRTEDGRVQTADSCFVVCNRQASRGHAYGKSIPPADRVKMTTNLRYNVSTEICLRKFVDCVFFSLFCG